MQKFIKSLTKIAIKFFGLIILYLWASNTYRKYELFIMIGAGLLALKLVMDIYLAYSELKLERELLETKKAKKAGKVIGKKHAAPQKVVVKTTTPTPDVKEESTDGKKIGRWLSLKDGRKLFEWDGHFVKDSKGLVMYEWDGKYFTTGIGVKLYELDGNFIKQVYGPKLFEFDGKYIKKNTGYIEYEWDGKTIKQPKGRLNYQWDGDDFPIIMAIVVLINDMYLKG